VPHLTRLGVTLSFLYLLASVAVGAWILTLRGMGWGTFHPRWIAVHIEWMALGFMLQFSLSMAFWILPKFGTRRGREKLATLGLGMLNAGLLLHTLWPGGVGRGMEGLACGLLFLALWRRVKPPPFLSR